MTQKVGLLERLESGVVLAAEGYVFELERRRCPNMLLHPMLGSRVKEQDETYLKAWKD